MGKKNAIFTMIKQNLVDNIISFINQINNSGCKSIFYTTFVINILENTPKHKQKNIALARVKPRTFGAEDKRVTNRLQNIDDVITNF